MTEEDNNDFDKKMKEFMKLTPKNHPINSDKKNAKKVPKNIKDWLKNG